MFANFGGEKEDEWNKETMYKHSNDLFYLLELYKQ